MTGPVRGTESVFISLAVVDRESVALTRLLVSVRYINTYQNQSTQNYRPAIIQ